MPRLSLYRPEKGNDYKFIDRQINEMFQVGGTDLYIHKYLGPVNPSAENATADQPQYDAVKETNIQDLLLLENRDRKYDPSIFRIRGVYNVQDIDFNLSQFGLFIDNDTVYMTVHINEYIRTVGRKPLNGDVIEVPHLKDEFALNNFDVALPRYFVISDVGRAAEGFSPTWYPHLYRLKLTKIIDSQQYKEIFDQKVNDDSDLTLRDILSTQNVYIQANDAALAQADADAPLSGYETRQFYTLAVDPTTGNALLETADTTEISAANLDQGVTASSENARPKRPGYVGYLLGEGVPENGAAFGHGITFPSNPLEGDYYLRTDFLPNRLFKFDGFRWVKREDAVRTTMSNVSTRNTLKGTFINNINRTGVGTLAADIIEVTTNTIDTGVNYSDGMYAIAASPDSPFKSVPVSAGTDGKAIVELPEEFQPGTKVDYKVYTESTEERQPLSKVLKPKADF